jgi:hypothetical protein
MVPAGQVMIVQLLTRFMANDLTGEINLHVVPADNC